MKTDAQLQADVLAELAWDAQVRGSQIRVVAKDGAVILTGTVQSYAEKAAAERAVKRVEGVRAIAQDIEVRPPDGIRQSDRDIAERFARLAAWTSALRDTDVIASVKNGYVTLTGEVDHAYQKQIAAERVGELDGVIALANDIEIRPRPAANGNVTLEGTIPEAASATTGAQAVENGLRVD